MLMLFSSNLNKKPVILFYIKKTLIYKLTKCYFMKSFCKLAYLWQPPEQELIAQIYAFWRHTYTTNLDTFYVEIYILDRSNIISIFKMINYNYQSYFWDVIITITLIMSFPYYNNFYKIAFKCYQNYKITLININ